MKTYGIRFQTDIDSTDSFQTFSTPAVDRSEAVRIFRSIHPYAFILKIARVA